MAFFSFPPGEVGRPVSVFDFDALFASVPEVANLSKSGSNYPQQIPNVPRIPRTPLWPHVPETPVLAMPRATVVPAQAPAPVVNPGLEPLTIQLPKTKTFDSQHVPSKKTCDYIFMIILLGGALVIAYVSYKAIKRKQKGDDVFAWPTTASTPTTCHNLASEHQKGSGNSLKTLTSGAEVASKIAENKPLVIAFTSTSCGHCTAMKPKLTEAAKKATIPIFDFVFDGKSMELLKKYKVDGFPTVLRFDKGQLTKSYSGDRSADSLAQFAS